MQTAKLTIPATRYTREVQIAVSPRAASITFADAVAAPNPFVWSLSLYLPRARLTSRITGSECQVDIGSFWFLVRSNAALRMA